MEHIIEHTGCGSRAPCVNSGYMCEGCGVTRAVCGGVRAVE